MPRRLGHELFGKLMSARAGYESGLQRELRDLICLAVVGDHVRWVLTDDDELGAWLAEAARKWRG